MTNSQLVLRCKELNDDIRWVYRHKRVDNPERGTKLYKINKMIRAKMRVIESILNNRGKNLLYWFGEFYLSDDFAEIAGPKTDRPVYEPESNERRVRSFIKVEWKSTGLNQWYLNNRRQKDV